MKGCARSEGEVLRDERVRAAEKEREEGGRQVEQARLLAAWPAVLGGRVRRSAFTCMTKHRPSERHAPPGRRGWRRQGTQERGGVGGRGESGTSAAAAGVRPPGRSCRTDEGCQRGSMSCQ